MLVIERTWYQQVAVTYDWIVVYFSGIFTVIVQFQVEMNSAAINIALGLHDQDQHCPNYRILMFTSPIKKYDTHQKGRLTGLQGSDLYIYHLNLDLTCLYGHLSLVWY